MKHKYKLALMDMAERFGQTSEATRLKVGALLYKNDNIISMGVNGTRAGWYTNKCEDEHGVSTAAVRHAEAAALDKLRRSHETSIGATLFCSHACCLNCAVEIAEAGITKVYYRHQYKNDDGIAYLTNAGIEVEQLGTELEY